MSVLFLQSNISFLIPTKKKKAIANHNLLLANSGAAGYVLPQWKAVKALEYIFIVSFH